MAVWKFRSVYIGLCNEIDTNSKSLSENFSLDQGCQVPVNKHDGDKLCSTPSIDPLDAFQIVKGLKVKQGKFAITKLSILFTHILHADRCTINMKHIR